eukprot:Rmarinus@m.1281
MCRCAHCFSSYMLFLPSRSCCGWCRTRTNGNRLLRNLKVLSFFSFNINFGGSGPQLLGQFRDGDTPEEFATRFGIRYKLAEADRQQLSQDVARKLELFRRTTPDPVGEVLFTFPINFTSDQQQVRVEYRADDSPTNLANRLGWIHNLEDSVIETLRGEIERKLSNHLAEMSKAKDAAQPAAAAAAPAPNQPVTQPPQQQAPQQVPQQQAPQQVPQQVSQQAAQPQRALVAEVPLTGANGPLPSLRLYEGDNLQAAAQQYAQTHGLTAEDAEQVAKIALNHLQQQQQQQQAAQAAQAAQQQQQQAAAAAAAQQAAQQQAAAAAAAAQVPPVIASVNLDLGNGAVTTLSVRQGENAAVVVEKFMQEHNLDLETGKKIYQALLAKMPQA